MEKSVQITLIIVGAILLITAAAGFGLWALVNPSNDISVNGVATLKAVPDVITVYFNVETIGSTAQIAKDDNAAIVDEVTTRLVKLGLERKDITTENFNIGENWVWENNKNVMKGYKAAHNIKVQLPSAQTDIIGKVIDAGVDGGAMISYINFELSTEKENEYKAQALKLASQDARTKAEAMVSGIGKEIVDIKSISESSFNYRPWMLYAAEAGVASAADAKLAATNIQPGEKEVNAQVTVVFKIG